MVCSSWLIQFPMVSASRFCLNPCLTSLNNGLWRRRIGQISPFLPYVAIGHGILLQQHRGNYNSYLLFVWSTLVLFLSQNSRFLTAQSHASFCPLNNINWIGPDFQVSMVDIRLIFHPKPSPEILLRSFDSFNYTRDITQPDLGIQGMVLDVSTGLSTFSIQMVPKP